MVNLEKLKTDALLAKMLGEAASHIAVDNGSANLDATFLRLERGVRSAPVVEVLRSVGLAAHPERWLGRGVMVQPPGTGQANKRYAANQAMYQSLTRAGWPVTPYHQMD